MQRITLTKPDDWHLHLRGGHVMKSVVGMSALQMGRGVIMPNLSPPIRNVSQAIDYRKEIMSALPAETTFNLEGCLIALGLWGVGFFAGEGLFVSWPSMSLDAEES